MTDKTPNRIWIELERPGSNEEGRERAKLLSQALLRLGYDGRQPACFWNEKRQCYSFTIDASGSYVDAEDHGHWYSLDYLGRANDNAG